jgi:hypothetical protein
MSRLSPKVITTILDEGHPVLVFLPKPSKRQADVLDEVLGRLGGTPVQGRQPAKARELVARPRSGKRVLKGWSKREILALNLLRSRGDRGAISKFAKKTGRTYWSVVSKSSSLGGGSPRRRESLTDLDREVLGLARTRPREAARRGSRALSALGM